MDLSEEGKKVVSLRSCMTGTHDHGTIGHFGPVCALSEPVCTMCCGYQQWNMREAETDMMLHWFAQMKSATNCCAMTKKA